jgi:hypothetical protein
VPRRFGGEAGVNTAQELSEYTHASEKFVRAHHMCIPGTFMLHDTEVYETGRTLQREFLRLLVALGRSFR